jgi:hypothetical protein
MSLNCGHQRSYFSPPRRYNIMESHGGMIWTGENRRTRSETCPGATMFSTNLTLSDPGANLGHHGERPETNRLSHGTVFCSNLIKRCVTLAVDILTFQVLTAAGMKMTLVLDVAACGAIALITGAVSTSKTSVISQGSIRRSIPEDSHLRPVF